MNKIDNTILTRKAFRDMTWLEGGSPKVNSIYVSSRMGRWDKYKDTMAAIDRCFLPAGKKGNVLTLTLDSGRAACNRVYTHCTHTIARYSKNEFMNSEILLEGLEAVKDITGVHSPVVDAVHLENINFAKINISHEELTSTIKKAFSESVLIIVNPDNNNTLGSLLLNGVGKNSAELQVQVEYDRVRVLKSPSGFQDYDYSHMRLF